MKTIVRAQQRGPITDVWYEGEPLCTVYCEHGKTWPEGGYGCIPCMKAHHSEVAALLDAAGDRYAVVAHRLAAEEAAERLPSDPQPVPQPSEEEERRMMEDGL
jgi:hypothetical protein